MPRQVLLVENNDADAHLIAEALADSGTDLHVSRVQDGLMAVEAIERDVSGFDLVLLDLRMHRLSGEDVLSRLSGRARPPIIILSGSADPLDEARCRELGADDYQTKPALPDEYRALARAICARWLPGRDNEFSFAVDRSSPLAAVRAVLHGVETAIPKDVLACFIRDDGDALARERGASVASSPEPGLSDWLERLASVRTAVVRAPPAEDEALRAWANGLRAIDARTSALVRASVAGFLEAGPRQEESGEPYFRLAVEQCPVGLLMVDEAGRMLLVNQEMEQMFGYRREELVGQRVEMLVPAAQRTRHDALRRDYREQHPEARLMGAGRDLSGLRKDGTRFPVEVGLRPVDTEEGRFTVATVIDIVERTELLSLLAERTAELRRSNEDLRQFASVVSHDLREPLRAVSNFTTLLKERYGEHLDDDANRYLDFARDGALRARELMNDLLDYARLGRAGRPPSPVAIDDCLDRVETSLGVAIHSSGARIERSALPTVIGTETLLDRLFHNLVDNAIKFRSEQAPVIRFEAERDGDYWVIRCIDNGIGIDESVAGSVFEVFRRLHTQAEYPGTGMGLAIAKRVVEHHSGTMRVESDGASGSTFVFTLPASPDDTAPPAG